MPVDDDIICSPFTIFPLAKFLTDLKCCINIWGDKFTEIQMGCTPAKNLLNAILNLCTYNSSVFKQFYMNFPFYKKIY